MLSGSQFNTEVTQKTADEECRQAVICWLDLKDTRNRGLDSCDIHSDIHVYGLEEHNGLKAPVNSFTHDSETVYRCFALQSEQTDFL